MNPIASGSPARQVRSGKGQAEARTDSKEPAVVLDEVGVACPSGEVSSANQGAPGQPGGAQGGIGERRHEAAGGDGDRGVPEAAEQEEQFADEVAEPG